ncbi:uncharacterized protein E0L32_006411 [Thyridium curvatum]|uniref:GYF domain-containing protein n=1 Tax=Thyridium curvatum TaxID=1093900 RepID=A0A507B811_9PEZI|nr:uncharacterized protein E0L32_006411 [Thyridium curvatum]TPX13211.1 hypothetical protein E0L32_006411 [Thyridium curvatum]
MASRYSAARPRRAGEAFARSHHGEGGDGGSGDDEGGHSAKKVKFDVRNPSALAPDAREEDDVLDADVIGSGAGATKRGAVNIDGYDSDSDNDTFNARAETRTAGGKGKGKGSGEGDVNLADQLDNYDSRLKGDKPKADADDDDDDDDMFAMDDDDDDAEEAGKPAEATTTGQGKKDKSVRFLADEDILGQEEESKSGGHIRLDDEPSSDEEDAQLAIAEEAVDEEVGAGGLKRHAPRIDAFNMKSEQEEGAFDEAGNFVRKAADPDAVHDRWLDGLSKKDMRRAAEAHERREADRRQQRREADGVQTADLLASLIRHLELGETALEALARLGRALAKHQPKKVPKWKQKKQHQHQQQQQHHKNGGAEAMDVDHRQDKEADSPQVVKIKKAIDAITEAADGMLGRDSLDIYDKEREILMREYRNETGEAWVDPPEQEEAEDDVAKGSQMWEYRWTDGRDGADKQGPFDGPTMKAWQDAGYFGEGVEFRPAGEEGGWTRVAHFV